MPELSDDDDDGLNGKRAHHIDHDCSGRSENVNRPSECVKTPCLIFIDIFCQSFGDGLINQRLSVCLSLHMKEIQRVCSNMCFALKPTRPAIKALQSSCPAQTTTREP